ncbi:GNAT family N-acetyltransferase [Phyllobacterium sp. SYP-B3895]|uniref:helix-turn-helix domain-containing GNAT family N-acetyltransferase n=1 Tax=Phyllobacterium sp. SYP-B3895 TaxID=2663240 RepID=UPI0012996AB5|nr:helix-turn-helix domain-containing GNAT family N-acetyltransferase [Phyllobacterium sp. SYP-B3895]MRG57428.1 GNAT family N-acetyltransferase [Phyllobacterium sp. SYP-B3895]
MNHRTAGCTVSVARLVAGVQQISKINIRPTVGGRVLDADHHERFVDSIIIICGHNLPMGNLLMQSTIELRRFNSFYIAKFGLLDERYAKSGHTIALHKVASQIAAAGTTTATQLASVLGMDKAQISRILSRMLSLGLIDKTVDKWNLKSQLIQLSDRGRTVLDDLEREAEAALEAVVGKRSATGRRRLLEATQEITSFLGNYGYTGDGTTIVRDIRQGEAGWVIYRHATIFARDFPKSPHPEARLIADFANMGAGAGQQSDCVKVALRDGDIVGWVFVRSRKRSAELMHLCVEPTSRKIGVGTKLLQAALAGCASGVKTLSARADSHPDFSVRFFEKSGFHLSRTPSSGKRLYVKTMEGR